MSPQATSSRSNGRLNKANFDGRTTDGRTKITRTYLFILRRQFRLISPQRPFWRPQSRLRSRWSRWVPQCSDRSKMVTGLNSGGGFKQKRSVCSRLKRLICRDRDVHVGSRGRPFTVHRSRSQRVVVLACSQTTGTQGSHRLLSTRFNKKRGISENTSSKLPILNISRSADSSGQLDRQNLSPGLQSSGSSNEANHEPPSKPGPCCREVHLKERDSGAERPIF